MNKELDGVFRDARTFAVSTARRIAHCVFVAVGNMHNFCVFCGDARMFTMSTASLTFCRLKLDIDPSLISFNPCFKSCGRRRMQNYFSQCCRNVGFATFDVT